MKKETVSVKAFIVIVLVANMFIIAVSGLVVKEYARNQYRNGYQAGNDNAKMFIHDTVDTVLSEYGY